MKHNNALLHGCLLAAGLTLLPFAAHATGLSNHFLAENSFTQSVDLLPKPLLAKKKKRPTRRPRKAANRPLLQSTKSF